MPSAMWRKRVSSLLRSSPTCRRVLSSWTLISLKVWLKTPISSLEWISSRLLKSPPAMRAACSVSRSTGLVMVLDSRNDRKMATTSPNSMARIRMVNRFQFSSCSSVLSSKTPTT